MLKFNSRSNTEYLYNYINNKIYPLSSLNEKKLKSYDIDFFSCNHKDLKKNSTRCLVINITNKCNMRCLYCAYSGIYKYERLYSNKSIDFETAKKAIDIFLTRKEDKSIINFYGGEPTLEFQLLKKIVKYIYSKTRDINFSINTNFYNINNEMIDFFIENNFKLFISIDGSKFEHDKNRQDINKKGTYEHIYNNIVRLFNKNSDYFKLNVLYLCVLSYPYDLNDIYNLYNSNTLFNQPWSISSVMPFNTVLKTSTNLFDSDKYFTSIMRIANDYIESIINNKFNHFGTWVFGRILKKIYYRDMNVNSKNYINNCCIPGASKLFVDCDGRFWPCERSENFMNIGSIEEGVRPLKSYYFIKRYKYDCNKNCSTCDNVRFCDLCYVSTRENGSMNFENKHLLCNERKERLRIALYIYSSIMEYDTNALNYLREIF